MPFTIDMRGDAPIYQRLADAIRRSIESGELSPGEKLPTVRELGKSQGIAGGTIRHAYGQLAREGWLQMSQGKGTFVTGPQAEAPVSRERQAMEAIGGLLDELSALNFSRREMQMFFSLKLSERAPTVILTPVALIDCNQEVLSEMVGQLSGLSGIELTEYLLDDARRAPGDLFQRYSLIITTQTHYHEVCSLLPEQAGKVVRAVLTPSQQTVIAIARIEAGAGVGIFCRSLRFAGIIRDAVRMCPHLRSLVVEQLLSGSEEPLAGFLHDKQVLLVSPDYLTYVGAEDQATLRGFAERGGSVIPYHYQIDQGSYLYIEEHVQEITR